MKELTTEEELKQATKRNKLTKIIAPFIVFGWIFFMIWWIWDSENDRKPRPLEIYAGYRVVDKQEGVQMSDMSKCYQVQLENDNEIITVATSAYSYTRWQVGDIITKDK